MIQDLDRFIDDQGRLKQWPAKPKLKLEALKYLATKFEFDRKYHEKEMNKILKQWHTFEDWSLLRRELYDKGFFDRNDDGTDYERQSNVKELYG